MAVSALEVDSDATLVAAAQAGDTAAFGELYRRHFPAVRRVCARRTGNLVDADEIAQAALVRAFERIDKCQGDRRFGGWVQTIAHNLAMDAHRARARVTPDESPVRADLAAPGTPEDALLQREKVQLVRDALAELPDRQRQVVVARDLEGRRPTEIAAAFGLTLGAVDSLLLRGRRRLASAVETMTAETGAATPATVAGVSAAAGGVGSSGPLSRAVEAVGDLVLRVSHQVATTFGLVPGAPAPGARFAAMVATAAALAPLAAPPAEQAAPLPALPPPVVETVEVPPVAAPEAPVAVVPPTAPAAPESPAPPVPATPAVAAPEASTPAPPGPQPSLVPVAVIEQPVSLVAGVAGGVLGAVTVLGSAR